MTAVWKFASVTSISLMVAEPFANLTCTSTSPDKPELSVTGDGVSLAVGDAGEGTPVVLLHGLTATRRYVVMGSSLLERTGHRVVAYDARGHGKPSPPDGRAAYRDEELVADLDAVHAAPETGR